VKKSEVDEKSLSTKIQIKTIQKLVDEVEAYEVKIQLAQKLKSLMAEKEFK